VCTGNFDGKHPSGSARSTATAIGGKLCGFVFCVEHRLCIHPVRLSACLPVCLSVVLDKLWNSSQILRRNATSSYREHLIGVGQRSALEFLNVRSLNDALSCFVGKQKLQGNARTTGERRGRKGSDLRSCVRFVT